MRQNNLISSIWKSFYSKQLYQDVAQNWGFGVIAYLLLLVLIYTGVASYNHNSFFHKAFNLTTDALVAQFPTGTINNGKMSIEQQSPYNITLDPNLYGETGDIQTLAVFDMHDKITPEQTNAIFIFHSNGYYLITGHTEKKPIIQVKKIRDVSKNQQNSYQFKFYPSKSHYSFSKTKAEQWASKAKTALPLLLLALIFMGQFIFKLLQAVVYALIALIFSLFCKTNLTYGQSYRLALVAITPAFFLINIAEFYLDIQHAWLIAFLIEIGYLFFAVFANRSNHVRNIEGLS